MKYLLCIILSALLIPGVAFVADSAASQPAPRVVSVERVTLLNAPNWRAYYDTYQLSYTDPVGAPDLFSEIAHATARRPAGRPARWNTTSRADRARR